MRRITQVQVVAIFVVVIVSAVGIGYMIKPDEESEVQVKKTPESIDNNRFTLKLGETLKLSGYYWMIYSGVSHRDPGRWIACISIMRDWGDEGYVWPIYVQEGEEFVIMRTSSSGWSVKVISFDADSVELEVIDSKS